jgi:predicted  nucleic acid-binding Zn-ribbon protein
MATKVELEYELANAKEELADCNKTIARLAYENKRLAGQLAEFTATVQSQRQMLDKLEKRLMNYEKGRYDS